MSRKLKQRIMEKFFYNTYFENLSKFNIRVYHDQGERKSYSSYTAHRVVETDYKVKVWMSCSCSHQTHTERIREYDKEEIKGVVSGLKTFWKREGWEGKSLLSF